MVISNYTDVYNLRFELFLASQHIPNAYIMQRLHILKLLIFIIVYAIFRWDPSLMLIMIITCLVDLRIGYFLTSEMQTPSAWFHGFVIESFDCCDEFKREFEALFPFNYFGNEGLA